MSADFRQNPSAIWETIDAEIGKMVESDEELAGYVVKMNDDELGQFVDYTRKKLSELPEFSVVVEPERREKLRQDSVFPTPFMPEEIVVSPEKTRPLYDRDTETLWAAYKNASENIGENSSGSVVKPLSDLSPEQAGKLHEIAKAENSPMAVIFRLDPKYLEALEKAIPEAEQEARATRKQLDGLWEKEAVLGRTEGYLKRGANKLGFDLAKAVYPFFDSDYKDVPFGNPDGLSDEQIEMRAKNAAMMMFMGRAYGTEDFEDDRPDKYFRFLRGAGEFASYAMPTTPGGAAFGLGAKAGSKVAAKAGIENSLGKAIAVGGSGGAAAALPGTVAQMPADPRVEYDGADFTGDLGANAAAEAAGAAAFGAGIYGLGRAAQALKGKYNPLYKTTFDGSAEDFSRIFNTIYRRSQNGEISPKERGILDGIAAKAREDGINVQDVLDGKIGARYFEQTLRPWIENTPILRDILPGWRRGYEFRETPGAVEPPPRGEAFDAAEFNAKSAGAVAATRPPAHSGKAIEAETLTNREWRIVSAPKFSKPDIPFYVDEAQTVFESPKDFTEWLMDTDADAERIYDRFKYLGNREQLWNGDYLPLFAKKYGASVQGLNAAPKRATFKDEALQAQKIVDSIPDDDIAMKIEAIEATEPELLSDSQLDWAVDNGLEWAGEEIVRRQRIRDLREASAGIGLLDRLDEGGIKLPTPKSMAAKPGSLAAEMRRIYDALPFDVKSRYFTARDVKLDEVAGELGYESEADFINAVSEAFAGRMEILGKQGRDVEGPGGAMPLAYVKRKAPATGLDDNFVEAKNLDYSQPVEIVVNRIELPEGMRTNEMGKWAKNPQNNVLGEALNLDTNIPYRISVNSINKIVSARDGETPQLVEAKFALLANIKELVQKARKTGELRKSKGDREDPDLMRLNVFHVPFRYGGNLYRVRIIGKEFKPELDRLVPRIHSGKIDEILIEEEGGLGGFRSTPESNRTALLPGGAPETVTLGRMLGKETPAARGGSETSSSSNHEYSQPKSSDITPEKDAESQALKSGQIKRRGSSVTPIQTPDNPSPSFVDDKPADFLSSVKPDDVSKVVDNPDINAFVGGYVKPKPGGGKSYKGQETPAENPDAKLWEKERAGAGHLNPRDIRPGTLEPKGTPSAGDIRRYFEKALDIPIRKKVGRRSVLGMYHPLRETIRLKDGYFNDIRVFSHEIGHDIHEKLFPAKTRKAGARDDFESRPAVRKELYDLATERFGDAYAPEKRVSEGVAEFMHDWLNNPAIAAESAPQFFKLFTEQLGKYPDVKHVLETGQKLIKQHYEAPAVERVRSFIKSSSDVWEKKNVAERMGDFVRKGLADWENELHPLWLAQKELKELGADTNFYDLAVNYKGGALGKAQYAVMDASIDLWGREIGPSLRQILAKVGSENLDDFAAYLVSRRALTMDESQSGIPLSDAKAVVDELGEKFERPARLLQNFQDQQLKLLYDSGFLTQQGYQKMKKANRNYVPFYRFREALTGTGGPNASQGFVNTANPVKRFRGSDREIMNPLESVIKNAFLFRDMAERNIIADSFVSALAGVQGSGRIAEPFFRRMQPTKLRPEEIKAVLRESGLAENLQVADGKGGMRPAKRSEISRYLDKVVRDSPIYDIIWREADATDPQRGVFKVWQDGKPKYWQLDDPELYRALTLADSGEMRFLENFPLAKVLTAPARTLRAGAVLDPAFAAKNPMRDQYQAAVYSKNGYIPFVSAFQKGFFEILTNGKYYREWKRSGGRFADLTSVDRADMEKLLEKASPGTLTGKIKTFSNPLEALRALSELTESMTRVAEYRLAREHGKSPMQAANESKEITLNFSRYGKYGKILNRIIPFFNAAVQDISRFAREYFNPHNPHLAKSWIKALTFVSMPSVALWYLNKDDEEIQDLPKWRKNSFWNFRVGDTIWSVPKPFLLGTVFANVPERILDFIYDKNPESVSESLGAFFDAVNPFGLPTAISVPSSAAANYNPFLGSDIEGLALQGIVPSQRSNANTSTTAMALTDLLSRAGMEVSPVVLDYGVQGFTGGLGRLALAGTDAALEAAFDLPERPDGGWKRSHVVRAFNVNPLASNRHVGDFYDEYKKIRQRATTKNRVLDGKMHSAEGWLQRNVEQLAAEDAVIGIFDEAAKEFREINDRISSVRNNPDLSGRKKYDILVNLTREKNQKARAFMLNWRNLKKHMPDE